MANEKKITKAEMFATISELLADNEAVVNFCNHEIELLSKKRASGSKPTKTQVENEKYKLEMLSSLEGLDREVTIGELMNECEAVSGLTNQRVSALMTQLKNEGKVVRTENKGKAFFKIA